MTKNSSNWVGNTTLPVVPHPPVYLLTVTTFLYVAIFIVGVFGNFAVIAVVKRCRSMRTFFNILFLNLCLADLLVLLIMGPTAVVDIYAREVWFFGRVMCKLIPFVENVVGNASALTILAISIERYRLAYRCSQHRKSFRVIVLTFVAIWTPAAMFSLPFIRITQYKDTRLVDGTPVMVCNTPIYLPWHKVYIVFMTFAFLLIPLLAVIVLYIKVCRKLVLLYRKERIEFESPPIEIIKLKRQMIQIVATVVLIFFVCHTPYRAVVIWTLFEKRENLRDFGFESYLTVLYLTRILLYANHAINPFVYNFVSRKFRRALKWICFGRRLRLRKLAEPEVVMSNVHHRKRSEFGQSNGFLPIGCHGDDKRESWRVNRNQRNDFLTIYKNMILLE